jgi:hypothetical protein
MKITLHNSQQAHQVVTDIYQKMKPHFMGGKKFTLEVTSETRSQPQNEMYHAIIGQIAKQANHAGAKWDGESWKRFLIDQWASETGRSAGKVAPSLDGQRVVQLGLQSRKFNKADASEFTEFCMAWAAQNGVTLDEG